MIQMSYLQYHAIVSFWWMSHPFPAFPRNLSADLRSVVCHCEQRAFLCKHTECIHLLELRLLFVLKASSSSQYNDESYRSLVCVYGAVCFSYEDTHLDLPLCMHSTLQCLCLPALAQLSCSGLVFFFELCKTLRAMRHRAVQFTWPIKHIVIVKRNLCVGVMCLLCVSHPGARLLENGRLGRAGRLSGVNSCINAELVELNKKKKQLAACWEKPSLDK